MNADSIKFGSYYYINSEDDIIIKVEAINVIKNMLIYQIVGSVSENYKICPLNYILCEVKDLDGRKNAG